MLRQMPGLPFKATLNTISFDDVVLAMMFDECG